LLDTPIVLDTCVFLNVVASSEIESIVENLSSSVLVCAEVEREALFLRDEGDDKVRVAINAAQVFESGAFVKCDLNGADEEDLFVELATHVDDGEAMAMAIAMRRKHDFATDDRKARRVFVERGAEEQRLHSTPSILRRWAERASVNSDRCRSALQRIVRRARFFPRRDDPDWQWWNDSIA
jgi:predicted nucleic acid-binding protein